ncbi:hypothetical protein D9V87_02980 [Bacteroidetes/Chlorobi group bacterium MS-B_bin-24]|nr:MAG: hypothetical protein D9V87_02980 [Bacteroidetes/Chlorobi group bacterium MS-B_bin-24]
MTLYILYKFLITRKRIQFYFYQNFFLQHKIYENNPSSLNVLNFFVPDVKLEAKNYNFTKIITKEKQGYN